MSRNIMSNERPIEVTGEFDPCKPEGCGLQRCYIEMQKRISYAHFQAVNDKEQCQPERIALDQCREANGMPTYRQMRKQDDVPRAPFRKHPTASDRMVQEYYPYPGGKIP